MDDLLRILDWCLPQWKLFHHFSFPIVLRGPTLLRPRSFSALSQFNIPT
ncbi:hypothetical protein BFJ63_vAg13573 [Fusarium oxysporum f. sp. narcissi]|uniref:Uncharacterized protein n=2 Tax=Fusarium oxysporum TaxID=5507 RepID=A0A420R1B3_FUSOX|nr:hypothetical protein BFJ68_g8456 [Fusarium oxysporum]RKL49106.1 hypothetical protein BFJ70_g2038 [Fusarium oxysporum]RYC83528.1 hypothetical protein BFJ63_vAg13573 [Fusarium oxysporum f. sp. narcissi]